MEGSSALQSLRGKRILVLGLGVNNAFLVPWLLKHGLAVTVRDQKPEVETRFNEQFPGAQGITWDIRSDTFAELEKYDVIFRSPAIPYFEPALQKAVARGTSVTSQTRLFFQLCPGDIIGVTGSKGKGTTSSLAAAILRAGYTKGKVYLAGNIGLDPFQFVDELTEDDLVILELSSFQLTDLHASPQVAVLLHVVPEHLNHHQTFEAYQEAKGHLLASQRPNDLAIVNTEYADMQGFLQLVQGKLLRYTRTIPQQDAAWVETLDGKEVVFVHAGDTLESIDISGRKLLGAHNLENILPAVLIALHYQVSPQVIQREVVAFSGLEHRLSHVVKSAQGVDFYDDSIATTPEASIAAMEAFAGRRIHLITGGRIEGQQFNDWAEVVAERCATVSFLPGAATTDLQKLLKQTQRRRTDCDLLVLGLAAEPVVPTVLSGIHPHLQSGDVVLLAPGVKSDKPYTNYKERGDDFRQAVIDRYGVTT